MDPRNFQLVFEGEVQPGHDPQVVCHTLADLFELDDEYQARLFGGEPIVLSKGMNAATASAFRNFLAGAGIVSQIVADDSPAATPAVSNRRRQQRRMQGKRRAQVRDNAILPDRRAAGDRRNSCKLTGLLPS